MAVDVGSAKGYLDLDISGFLAGLKTAQIEANSTSKNIATKIGSNLSNVGKGLTSAGKTLTKNVTIPLLGIGAAGIKVASDFEKGMSEVKAISGATGKDFDALKEKAVDLGASTAFSAGEVAAAMTEMAKAGWNYQQIIDGMEGVLAAAAASGEDLATVSTIVADAITGFGLSAFDSTRIADLLTQAANSGTIGITDLGESFKYIAPVANAMGLSVEDVTTAISAMSMAGIKGSQAGTSLRTMLTRMVKPTDDVAAAMNELGIVLTKEDGSFKSLDTIVSEMRGSFSNLTDKQKTYYATVLSGQEGMSGLLSLLNLTEEEYNEIAESMDNAGGVAEETAAIMQDNLQSKIEQLLGSLESLAIKLADFVIPYLQQFVVQLTSLVEKFTALDPETQKMILKFAGLAAVIGPALSILGKFTSGIGGIVTTFGKLGGGLKILSGGFTAVKAGGVAASGVLSKLGGFLATTGGTVTIVIAVIGALVAAFIYLWNNCEGFRNFFINMWENIKVAFQAFVDFISPAIESIKTFFISLWEKIQEIWTAFSQSLKPLVDEFVGAFQMAWDVIKLIWDYVQPYFAGIWEAIKAVFSIVGEWFKLVFGIAWENIKAVWSVVTLWFTLLWENIKAVFTPVVEYFKGIFSVAWEVIKAVWNTAVAFFTMIWAGIKAVFAVVKGILSGNFTDAWNAIKNVWDKVKNYFSTIWTGIKNVFGAVGSFFKNTFSAAWEAIKKIFSNFGTFFSGLWNTIKNAFTAIGTKIGNAISGAVKSGINGVLSMIQGTVNTFIRMINGAIGLINLIPGVEISKLSQIYIPRLAKGGVVNRATLAEIGEDGREAVVPLEKNLGWMKNLVKEFMNHFREFFNKQIRLNEYLDDIRLLCQNMLNVSKQLVATDVGYISYGGFNKTQNVNKRFDDFGSRREERGDTFNFYSPKPIDEIEAAKQMKKAKRDLAEGF